MTKKQSGHFNKMTTITREKPSYFRLISDDLLIGNVAIAERTVETWLLLGQEAAENISPVYVGNLIKNGFAENGKLLIDPMRDSDDDVYIIVQTALLQMGANGQFRSQEVRWVH